MIQQIQQAQPAHSIRALCEVVPASRSWYYAAPAAHEQRARRDADLRDAIEAVVLDFPGYGYRRVTRALQRLGWGVNHKRVVRVMRQEALLCHLQRHFVVTTTDAAHGYRTYPNLLAALTLDHLDQAWVADMTYIRLPTTFVYLACLLDACSTPTRAAWWAGSSRASSIRR